MSTQFKNIRTQTSAIRAWGDPKGFVVVELQISRGNEKKEESMTGSYESNVHMSDAYSLREGEWLAEFGTIKSMTGLSNKQIPEILQRLQKLGKFGVSKSESQWENICMLNGKLIWTNDLKNKKPKKRIVEDKPFADAVRRLEKIDLPEDTEMKPEDDQEFDSWLDKIIGIIGEVSEATPEQLRKLGAVLDTLGKELEETEEEESVVDILEDDEEEERLTNELMEEIKKGNKWWVDFFTKITEAPEEVIETPVEPNESPIANKIMEGVSSKEPESTGQDTGRSWGPKHGGSFHGDDTLTEQEIQQGQRRHRGFLDRILDEMVFCEPMSWLETQKRWEKTCRDMGKEWQRVAMNRRHKEQEQMSKWDLFNGLTGKTPPWPMMNPRDPEFWEPEI